MTVESFVVCGVAGVVAVVNAVTMRRLWASQAVERPQRIAQSLMLWLIPGSFLVVRHFLGDHLRRGRSLADGDTTSGDSGGGEPWDTGANHHLGERTRRWLRRGRRPWRWWRRRLTAGRRSADRRSLRSWRSMTIALCRSRKVWNGVAHRPAGIEQVAGTNRKPVWRA